MNIIDFHTHPFLNSFQNSCFYEGVVKTLDDFKNDMLQAGITHFCGSVIAKFNDFNSIHSLNMAALELNKIYGSLYTPGVHIHPSFVEQSLEELNFMHSQGVKLVGELVPYYNGWEYYYDENMHIIYEEISKLNMVVSLHTQHFSSIEQAVSAFPNITFVAAHPRDRQDYYTHLDLLKKYDNYYMDLSGTGLFRFGMLQNAVNTVGSEKIIFGTDYPICNPKMYIEAVLFEKISDSSKENILYNNAARILSL